MKPLLFLFALSSLIFFTQCKCDCPSGDTNSIFFTMRTSATGTGFTEEDVDTIYLFKLTKGTTVKLDSIMINSKKFTLSQTGSIFNGGDFWQNDYLVKTQGKKDFLITEMQIESGEDNSKCKCYVNQIKKLKVDGNLIDLSGKTWSDSNVTLSK